MDKTYIDQEYIDVRQLTEQELYFALKNSRDEKRGTSLASVIQIMREVFDKAELRSIKKNL